MPETLVDKCHLADIHNQNRRLKLTEDDSKYSDDRLQALAWIADRMEAGCVVDWGKCDRGMTINKQEPFSLSLCQTSNPGNHSPPVGSVLHALIWYETQYNKALLPNTFANLLEELEYGNTGPFSKFLLQK